MTTIPAHWVTALGRGIAGIAAFTVLAIPLQGQTHVELPDTPAAERFSEFLSVVNSGDYHTVRSYVERNLVREFIDGAVDARVDALMRIHTASRTLTVVQVRSSSRDRIITEVRNQLTDSYEALGVSVERRRPHRVTMWYRGPSYITDRPSGAPRRTESEILDTMHTFLDRIADAEAFSGTVLIGNGERVVLRRAVGLAHRDPDIATSLDTRFNIGSVGKLFTSVAIAQLAERGLLTYQDLIGRYLGPGWVSPDVASEIRIEHLLTHRSGLGDFLESAAMTRATAPPRSLDDYQPIIRAERPQFRPGTQFQYSNSGFILLGAIVERLSGQSFADYFHEHVFAPAQMVGLSNPPQDRAALRAPTFATGYTSHYSAGGKAWNDNTRRMATTAASPAGGQYASVEDLWRFALALKSGTVVADSTWQSLTAPVRGSGGPPRGYGFEIRDLRKERRVGHGGSHEGVGAVLDMYLNSGYTLVVLSNSDRSAFAVRQRFDQLMLR